MRGKNRKRPRGIPSRRPEITGKLIWRLEILLFVAYLALLCYFLFFADSMGRTYEGRAYHYNLTLLKEIKRFWKYRRTLDFWPVVINLFGNVVAFLPFGALLPSLFVRCRRFFLTTLLSFEFSLCVEIIQLVWKVGSFDVDDILLNTLGGALGFCIYWIFTWIKGRGREEKHEKKKPL